MFQKMRLWATFLLMTLLLLAACNQEPETPAATTAASSETSAEAPTAVAATPEGYPAPEQETVVIAEGYPAPEVALADGYPAPESVASAADASTQTFVIVPEESSASYIVSETFFEGAANRLGIEAGVVDTVGSTQDVSGQITLAFGETVTLESGSFEVNLNTLTSDQSRRDGTIRDDFLESTQFPIASFTATEIQNFPPAYREGTDITFQLVGDLTIRETTQTVTFEVTASLTDNTITASAVSSLTMSDFGVEPPTFSGILSVEDDFQVALDIVATAQ